MFIGGDIGRGNEQMMLGAEHRQLPYMVNLPQIRNVSRKTSWLAKPGSEAEWKSTEQGWESLGTTLRLDGWTRDRRVIVSRTKLREEKAEAGSTVEKRLSLPGMIDERCGRD